MAFAVPSVDLTPYRHDDHPGRAATAAAFDTACREVGFVQVHGHGVPEDVIAGLEAAVDDFFALPPEVKARSVTPPEVNRGYAPPKSEATSLSLGVEPADRMNDFFEAFNVGLTLDDYPESGLLEQEYQANVWPDVPGFEPRVLAYLAEARRVADLLIDVAGDALGLPASRVDPLFDRATGTMRMNNYALQPGMEVLLDGDLRGMGEHTDFGVVTVLWADRVAGLQVLGRDGAWHDVLPDPGALLVNLGDVTARWTNEHWMSTLHRVQPPIVDGTIHRRRSVAYFHGCNWDTLVAPLPELLAAGEEPLYDPVTAHDHYRAKLAGTRAGVRNTAAAREMHRVATSR